MSFGRQKNLVRRAVRPDGRVTRDLRRRSVKQSTLLDVQSSGKTPFSVRLAKMIAKILRIKGR